MQVIFRSDLSTPMLPGNMLSEMAWVNHALIALGLAHSQLSDYLGRVLHLVGCLEHVLFSHILGIVIPTD